METDPALAGELAALQKARIFFGHQSVGKEVLAGLQDLARGAGVAAPDIVLAGEKDSAAGPALIHAFIGQNEKPETKCRAMEAALANVPPGGYDVVLMKFCFIDFKRHTDVDALLEDYRRTIAGLKARHPQTVFVHATATLTSITLRDRVTAPIKSLLGRPNPEGANIKRNEFNRKLVAAFPGEPLFDLAAVESTRPDGKRETFEAGGETYYSLVNAYTYDGGHLNEQGRRRAAREFVRVLAAALAKKPAMEPAGA